MILQRLVEPVTNINTLKIFVVDDDAFNLKVTRFYLNRLGFKNVTVFNDGFDCLKEVSTKPNVIFLDQYMEGIHGIDVLKKIQELDPEIIVIMLSAEDSDLSARFFKQQGAFDYIVKGHEAMNRIEAVLNKIMLQAQTLKAFNAPM